MVISNKNLMELTKCLEMSIKGLMVAQLREAFENDPGGVV